ASARRGTTTACAASRRATSFERRWNSSIYRLATLRRSVPRPNAFAKRRSPRRRMMLTLGINAAFHDPAACLVRDGVVLAAAEDERFTHVKHGKRPVPFSPWELPSHAIDACLKDGDVDLADVDHVAYSFDPHILLGRWGKAATITLPLEPSAHPTPEEWLGA